MDPELRKEFFSLWEMNFSCPTSHEGEIFSPALLMYGHLTSPSPLPQAEVRTLQLVVWALLDIT